VSYRTDFVHGEAQRRVSVRPLDGRRFRVQIDAAVHEVTAEVLPDGRLRCTLDGVAFEADAAPCGKALQVRVDGRTWLLAPARGGKAGASATGSGTIEAPMTGTVTKVTVRAGDRVEPGAPIAVLTAMKMEHKLSAGVAGVVAELHAVEGTTVEQGFVLARITPELVD
jgi:biotin carboxyl carrier protein